MISEVDEILEELRNSKPIIIVDDEDRENEGDLYIPAEKCTPDIINFMITYAKGLLCMPVDENLAQKLDLYPMAKINTDSKETAFTVSIDHKDTSTGISAYERSFTISQCLKEEAKAEDFNKPGHIFPLIAKKNGVLERRGHTEASIDLANLLGLKPAGVICEIIREDGKMARLNDLEKMAKKFNLKILSIEKLVNYIKNKEVKSEAMLPTEFGDFKIKAFWDKNINKEHLAVYMGNIKDGSIVRIHSECLTGDVLGSLRCDCGKQLKESLRIISKNKEGILIYLRQEGRGIGLLNKIKAYNLQDQGLDTLQANVELGFNPDERDYSFAASILKEFNIKEIKLITNNPEKVIGLKKNGIKIIERIPIEIKFQKYNYEYMKTKKEKMNHLLKTI